MTSAPFSCAPSHWRLGLDRAPCLPKPRRSPPRCATAATGSIPIGNGESAHRIEGQCLPLSKACHAGSCRDLAPPQAHKNRTIWISRKRRVTHSAAL